MSTGQHIKAWAKKLLRDLSALDLAFSDPEVSTSAKFVALIIVAYALSPIDLIPDFIPVLGYLDDLILLPLGIALFIKLIPSHVMQRLRSDADERLNTRRGLAWTGAVAVGFVWFFLILVIWSWWR